MLTLTNEAQDRLNGIITEAGMANPHVRVSVVRGPHGCVHGWRLGLEEDQAPADVILSFGPLRLLFENDIADTLEGATIDYRVDERVIGFTIDAPGAEQGHGHDGCGHH
jgi:Fe-S cluster assembly iron-binding protein IscA